MSIHPPIPKNEFERILNLSDFNIDYSSVENNFKDLAKLAASVAGTSVSLVNLIDSYTQWTISAYGFQIDQMAREDSVCQYTIAGEDEPFEVKDLSKDVRFRDKFYVRDEPSFRYYYGIPLKSDEYYIGALCMLDKEIKDLSPEKVELLKIIADEIVNRLKAYKAIEALRNKVEQVQATQNKVVHDIRGPLAGIIGLAQIISEQGKDNKIEEVLEFINLIHKSGNSILELADEILSSEKKAGQELLGHELNLTVFKEKLDKLYIPQARSKNVSFHVNVDPNAAGIPFSKNKLLQISGNLISNAIKFTPSGGKVSVDLDLVVTETEKTFKIKVEDSGLGLASDKIYSILNGNAESEAGTDGEQGYGFGLGLVKHLIESLKGKFLITSLPGEGATFEVILSQPIV